MAESISKGENRWRIRIFCRRDELGKKIYCFDKTIAFESAKKKNAFVRDIETRHEAGTLHYSTDMLTLNKHLDKWLAHKRDKLEPNTYDDYQENFERYVRPFTAQGEKVSLGDRLLISIKPVDIQELYDDMGRRGLSARTIRYVHSILSGALEKAVWWDLIPSNPTRRTERPTGKKPQIEFLQPDEAPIFLKAARKDRLGAMFALMLSNGPRPEECFGLLWSDLDCESRRVHIRQVLKRNRKGGGWRFRTCPKTVASIRTLTLAPPIVSILQEHRTAQLVERMRAGRSYQSNNLVFCTPTGEPLSLTNVHRRNFRPIVTGGKLRDSLTLYSLRHSFATLSLAGGVDPKMVSADLGHESVAFTLDVYCKVVEKMRMNADGKLESILFPMAAKAR